MGVTGVPASFGGWLGGRGSLGQERRSISVKAPPSAPAHFRMGVDRGGASCHTSTNHTEHVSVASSAGSKGNKVSGPGTLNVV